MDPCEDLRQSVIARKRAQNDRCRRANKPLKWPKLDQPKPVKRASKAQKPPAPESGDEADAVCSFDEWLACGYSVKKGMKANGFDILGIPQFSRHQVHKTNPSWTKWRKRQS